MPCPATRQQEARAIVRTAAPIASAAALTAQPLAACPLRVASALQVGNDCSTFCAASPPSLSLRGGRRPTWQSRSIRLNRGKAIGEIATAFPRLPRRFAPRNDTSGRYCGAPAPSSGLIPLCKALNERRYRRNWLVRFCRKPVRIGGIAPGAACRSPTTHDRRSSYYSLFILQYSLFHPSPCGGWQTI